MSNSPVIEVKNISKKYNINHERGGYVTLRDVITNIFKNPFIFLKTKTKEVLGIDTKEIFWALKDINFEVMKGEVIGIIGRNGAGKSTLLKILSQITPPTTGEIRINGTVGSLLEVGTGFHPELTGRENIFLNGAILGMKNKEIIKKFDEIVEFAGIDKFLDTPVKYYSSGMYVRLAFSVAAHMDTDILIIDEVLAVGDAEFQKKCMGKMEDITKKEGRTIIFVSHNSVAIKELCKKTIWIEKGQIKQISETDEVMNNYLEKDSRDEIIIIKPNKNLDAQIKKVSFPDGLSNSSNIPINKDIIINIEYEIFQSIKNATICLIFSLNENILLNSYESDSSGELVDYEPGKYKTQIIIPAFTFNIGTYQVDVSIQHPGIDFIDRTQNINFKVIDKDNPRTKIVKSNSVGNMGSILNYKTESIK